ncbi:MAG TPA: alpha-E domain-containing protein [Candidatus Baltobacteraceae bacterium]|nr:alpha-E domain-containing protein [Candidatus Baltobacteraceae bacterium]
MLSRIAESLFWLARYIERAEGTARILDVNYHMLLEQSQQSYHLRWEPLIIMAGEEDRFRKLYSEVNAENVFEFLAFRPDNPSSIVQCISKARENARTIRDRISREMWEDINGLYYTVSQFVPREEIAAGPHRFCDRIKFGAHRFHGVTDATLPHDEGWEFLRIGWSLERAEMTARLVDVQYHNLLDGPPAADALDNHQWMAVLRSVGAYEAYHRQYHPPLEPEKVAEMLILHHQHPHSIRFNVAEFQASLRAVSGSGRSSYANEAERLSGKLVERLSYDKIGEIFKQGLHGYLNDVVNMCGAIGDDIARTYFYYAVVA